MTQSKLSAAMRARFKGGPRQVLEVLGLDADNLLAPAAPGGASDPLKEMRIEIENMLGELYLDEKQVGKILEVLDKHASFDKLDDSDPNAEKARELAGAADEDEDDADARIEKARGLLRKAGLSERDIADVVKIALGTATTVGDRLPVSGPNGMGGYRSDQERGRGEKIFQAADSIEALYPDSRLIVGERTRSTDTAPKVDDQVAEQMREMFGSDFDRIGTGAW